jgi:hypothetical protein
MIGARAVWAAMLGDVRSPRRPMARGGRCAGECGPATWHPPVVVNVTHRSTPEQRSDSWTFCLLDVCARRGYGAYGGAPTWPRATSRAERALAFQGKISLLNKFSNAIFFKF